MHFINKWIARYRDFRNHLFINQETTGHREPVIDEKTYYARTLHPLNHKRVKIIHVIANFFTGGSSRLVVDLFEHLGHKYDQEVITYCIPTPLAYAGLKVHEFSGDITGKHFEDFMKAKNAQILHVHYWGVTDAPWYQKAFTAAENWSGVLIENINTPVEPYISDRIDHYVYVSEYAKDFAPYVEKKSSVIYPGSNLSLFDRKEVQIPDNVIGMVYRLDPDKLKEESIRVFIEVVKKRPETQVLIIGGGTFLNSYQTQVEEAGVTSNFQFTGYVSYEKLPEYYQKLSVFVAPVWSESFGQVSPFAMGMKIPVAGYRIGGLPEILGSNDLLANNTDELSDIIVKLLDDRPRRIEIGDKNYLRVHERFSVEAMVSAYDQLYERLIRDH